MVGWGGEAEKGQSALYLLFQTWTSSRRRQGERSRWQVFRKRRPPRSRGDPAELPLESLPDGGAARKGGKRGEGVRGEALAPF